MRYGVLPKAILREWSLCRMYIKDASGSKSLLHTWSEKNGHYVVKDTLKKALGARADQYDQFMAELDCWKIHVCGKHHCCHRQHQQNERRIS